MSKNGTASPDSLPRIDLVYADPAVMTEHIGEPAESMPGDRSVFIVHAVDFSGLMCMELQGRIYIAAFATEALAQLAGAVSSSRYAEVQIQALLELAKDKGMGIAINGPDGECFLVAYGITIAEPDTGSWQDSDVPF